MATMTRRDLLKRGAGLAAALAAPALLGGCGKDAGGGTDAGLGDAFLPDPGATDPGAEVLDPLARVHAVTADSLTGLYAMGLAAAEALFPDGSLDGKTLFLKPNFVALGMEMFGCGFDANTGECTKPELVLGAAEHCLKAGAKKVILGEGSQTATWEWDTVTFVTGNDIEGATNMKAAVARLATAYGADRVQLVCLNEADDWKSIPSASPADSMKDGLFVARAVFEADHIISLPVIKTHQWARMSGAMKNLFGSASITKHGNGISRCGLHVAYDKVACHGEDDAGVSGSFVDMVKWRKENGYKDFAIVDGSICLEGSGPHKAPVNDGRTIHMKDRNAAKKYFALATDDLVAADTTVAALIGFQVDDVKALRMARYLKLGATERIALAGATLDDLRIPDWMKPELLPESYFGFCK